MTPALMADIHREAFETPWNEAAFASLIDSPGVLVSGDERGFIMIRVVLDEAEILTVGVRPSQRRAGIGRQLVDKALVAAAARGAQQMFLEVAQSNIAAIGLYNASGFEQVGRRKGYYAHADGTHEDALMMLLNFAQ